MMEKLSFRKPASFRSAAEFREYLRERGIGINLAEGCSAFAKPISCFGRTIGNRWAVLPMEGWDCLADGTPSEFTRRRWLRFASSGAKLIFGTEAAAVMSSGRSNPRQLMCAPHTLEALKKLCSEMRSEHRNLYGTDEDLAIGLQLTHSGRFSHPNEPEKLEPRTAYAHPLLDRKFGCGASAVVTDDEIEDIMNHFVTAAEVAQEAGFDFIDFKHAHGYFAHELLTAYDRPGPFGGSFENRTRFFRTVAERIRKKCPGLRLAARFSIFDILPFVKGPDGEGHPMEWSGGRYPYAFGGDGTGLGMDPDLTESVRFVNLMRESGVEMICASIGSPYYNVHMQRPAYYAVSDGYPPPEDPLYNVSRHLLAAKTLREKCPGIPVVCSGCTCLQEFLPEAGEYALEHGETDFVGIGRMVLSYPEICRDVLAGKPLDKHRICRTFGECTNAPRNGMVSGCYPLDPFYRERPECGILKKIKKESGK